jgi:hypothetical protein
MSPRLPRREIDWNSTPWQEDIFDDNEDMQALRTSIVTINVALTVCLLTMFFLTMFYLNVGDELVVLLQSLADQAKNRDDLLKNAMVKERRVTELE